MSNIDKQSLRTAAENATPGEWCTDDYHGVIADAGLNANYYIASCSGPDNRSNKRFIAAANPATVLALLDELEAKDRRIEEEIARANREHHRGFMMACGHLKEHSNVHYADAAGMEIAALRNRINELEPAAAGKGE
ncbi:TPA: ead/Ea22-like family protein [Enterobacter hormaechei]